MIFVRINLINTSLIGETEITQIGHFERNIDLGFHLESAVVSHIYIDINLVYLFLERINMLYHL